MSAKKLTDTEYTIQELNTQNITCSFTGRCCKVYSAKCNSLVSCYQKHGAWLVSHKLTCGFRKEHKGRCGLWINSVSVTTARAYIQSNPVMNAKIYFHHIQNIFSSFDFWQYVHLYIYVCVFGLYTAASVLPSSFVVMLFNLKMSLLISLCDSKTVGVSYNNRIP